MGAWNLTPVDESPSEIDIPLEEISDEAAMAVNEAYEYGKTHPATRLFSPKFTDEAARNRAAAEMRNYAKKRPDGRLTVSVRRETSVPKVKDSKGLYLSIKVTEYKAPETTTPDAAANPPAE